jgi:hypothetical protein
MKKMFIIAALTLTPLFSFASFWSPIERHDCQLAANQVATHFFAGVANIRGLKVAQPVFFSTRQVNTYIFAGLMSNKDRYQIIVTIDDEDSCVPRLVKLKKDT